MTNTQQTPTGMQLIQAERERQINLLGWTPEHDDQHTGGELRDAAMYYHSRGKGEAWPWKSEPGRIDECQSVNHTKAGALMLAEIGRLERKLGRMIAECEEQGRPVRPEFWQNKIAKYKALYDSIERELDFILAEENT